MSTISLDSSHILPDDVLLWIFSFLPSTQLLQLQRLNRYWYTQLSTGGSFIQTEVDRRWKKRFSRMLEKTAGDISDQSFMEFWGEPTLTELYTDTSYSSLLYSNNNGSDEQQPVLREGLEELLYDLYNQLTTKHLSEIDDLDVSSTSDESVTEQVPRCRDWGLYMRKSGIARVEAFKRELASDSDTEDYGGGPCLNNSVHGFSADEKSLENQSADTTDTATLHDRQFINHPSELLNSSRQHLFLRSTISSVQETSTSINQIESLELPIPCEVQSFPSSEIPLSINTTKMRSAMTMIDRTPTTCVFSALHTSISNASIPSKNIPPEVGTDFYSSDVQSLSLPLTSKYSSLTNSNVTEKAFKKEKTGKEKKTKGVQFSYSPSLDRFAWRSHLSIHILMITELSYMIRRPFHHGPVNPFYQPPESVIDCKIRGRCRMLLELSDGALAFLASGRTTKYVDKNMWEGTITSAAAQKICRYKSIPHLKRYPMLNYLIHPQLHDYISCNNWAEAIPYLMESNSVPQKNLFPILVNATSRLQPRSIDEALMYLQEKFSCDAVRTRAHLRNVFLNHSKYTNGGRVLQVVSRMFPINTPQLQRYPLYLHEMKGSASSYWDFNSTLYYHCAEICMPLWLIQQLERIGKTHFLCSTHSINHHQEKVYKHFYFLIVERSPYIAGFCWCTAANFQ